MAVPIDTWASLVVTLPEELQLSNQPLYGSFYAECYGLDGLVHYTETLPRTASASDLQAALIAACPSLRD